MNGQQQISQHRVINQEIMARIRKTPSTGDSFHPET